MAILTKKEMIQELILDSRLFAAYRKTVYSTDFNYANLTRINNNIDCLNEIITDHRIFNAKGKDRLKALVEKMNNCGLSINANASVKEVSQKLKEELAKRLKNKVVFEALLSYVVYYELLTIDELRDAHFTKEIIDESYHWFLFASGRGSYEIGENGKLLQLNEDGVYAPIVYNPVQLLKRQHATVDEKLRAKGIK